MRKFHLRIRKKLFQLAYSEQSASRFSHNPRVPSAPSKLPNLNGITDKLLVRQEMGRKLSSSVYFFLLVICVARFRREQHELLHYENSFSMGQYSNIPRKYGNLRWYRDRVCGKCDFFDSSDIFTIFQSTRYVKVTANALLESSNVIIKHASAKKCSCLTDDLVSRATMLKRVWDPRYSSTRPCVVEWAFLESVLRFFD